MFSHELKGTEKTNCLKALDIHMPCFLIKKHHFFKKHTNFHKKEKKRKGNCRTTWYILKHLEIQQPEEFPSHLMCTQYITGLSKTIPQEYQSFLKTNYVLVQKSVSFSFYSCLHIRIRKPKIKN